MMHSFLPALALVLALSACKKRDKTAPAAPGPVEWVREALPSSDSKVEINAIGGSGPDDVWAVGWGIYHYDGKTWTNETPKELIGAKTALNAISVGARNDVWAVGVAGHVAHFDGKKWHVKQLDDAEVKKTKGIEVHHDLLDVTAWPGEVWASYASRSYYRFDGKEWTYVNCADCPYSTQAFWGATARDVWVPATKPARFDGTRWTVSQPELPAPMRAIHGSAADDVWMVGWQGSHEDNRGATSRFDGTRWTPVPVPEGTALLWEVYAAGRNEAYAVGRDGWAIAWNGSSWRPSATGVTGLLKAIYSPGKGVAFAGGQIGPYILRKK